MHQDSLSWFSSGLLLFIYFLQNLDFMNIGASTSEMRGETALTYSFSYLEPVCFSMSSSNYCFLTCIQISQEADQVVWYSHLLKNFPQFIAIHTVKGFGIVNKAFYPQSKESKSKDFTHNQKKGWAKVNFSNIGSLIIFLFF